MDKVTVVNMIPHAQSGETNQDSEPNLAVDPSSPLSIAGTAFTPNPGGGSKSPIFYSNDGGDTWNLLEIIDGTPVRDQTVRFGWTSGELYAGVLWGTGSNIALINYDTLRTNDFGGVTPMTRIARRQKDDQPFIQASTVPGGMDAGKDRVYVGSNDWAPAFPTASVDIWLDADSVGPSFTTSRLENRTVSRDGFQTRPAVAEDGNVYALYYAWVGGYSSAAVVIARDNSWGTAGTPFRDLTDTGDMKNGRRVQTGVSLPPLWTYIGQQRMGGDLSVAVDPNDSSHVYVVYGDKQAGVYSLHLRKSITKASSWGGDIRKVDNAVNPALAVNGAGRLGFLYQQLTGVYPNQRWQTIIELTTNDFGSKATHVLADTPASTPTAVWDPYLGDYLYMMAVGTTFYGIFCANNKPDMANFPSGVKYQRNADWGAHQLKNLSNNPVSVSIDPFFFKVEQVTKVYKELKPEVKELFYEQKPYFKEKIPKIEQPEKTIASELKFFDKLEDGWQWPVQEEELLRVFAKRLDEIEERMAKSRAFIREEERPRVGVTAPSKARRARARVRVARRSSKSLR